MEYTYNVCIITAIRTESKKSFCCRAISTGTGVGKTWKGHDRGRCNAQAELHERESDVADSGPRGRRKTRDGPKKRASPRCQGQLVSRAYIIFLEYGNIALRELCGHKRSSLTIIYCSSTRNTRTRIHTRACCTYTYTYYYCYVVLFLS